MRCSLARAGGHGTVWPMRELLILAIHLLVTLVKLLRPGGVRTVEVGAKGGIKVLRAHVEFKMGAGGGCASPIGPDLNFFQHRA